MATYPDLTDPALLTHEEHDIDDTSDDSSDDGEMLQEMLDFYYDEYGQVIQKGAQPAVQPEVPPVSPPSVPLPVPQGPPQATARPAAPPASKMSCGGSFQKQVTLTKDASGKLGIRLRRMGNAMFFAFVDKDSVAAKIGIGFGDQLLSLKGVHLPGMTGTSLMRWISQQQTATFYMTVVFRPYDFLLAGMFSTKGEITYSTKAGKVLGTVKIDKLCQKGHLKHLQLLEVNDVRVYGKKPLEVAAVLNSATMPLRLRVMPRIFVRHLMKGQDKEKTACRMHFSSGTE